MSDKTSLLMFGGFALLLLASLQAIRLFNDKKRARLSTNFSKNFGLIFIATIGALLTIVSTSDAARTGAFTLLGTVAGYLAGTKQTPDATAGGAATTPNAPSNADDDGESSEGIRAELRAGQSENDL